MKNCSGKPGVVYNFNNQCLISYQDNSHNKGDLPFDIYFDFETTAPTDNCLDPDVAFHPALKLERIIFYRSYAHPLVQLTTLHNFFSRANKFY